MVVKMRECTLCLFDSGGFNEYHDFLFDILNKFFRDHAIRTTGCTLQEICGSADDWVKRVEDCPRQGNGTDCGVFVCVNMLCAVFDLPLRMSQEIADAMRVKIGVSVMIESLS
jgi:Ulp1 family protease